MFFSFHDLGIHIKTVHDIPKLFCLRHGPAHNLKMVGLIRIADGPASQERPSDVGSFTTALQKQQTRHRLRQQLPEHTITK